MELQSVHRAADSIPVANFVKETRPTFLGLFPGWRKHKSLIVTIRSLQDDRVKLLPAERSAQNPSDTMSILMMQSSNLREEIEDFRTKCRRQVKKLAHVIDEALETIKDLKHSKEEAQRITHESQALVVLNGGMIPPPNILYDWEKDSIEEGVSPDYYAVMKTAEWEIADAEEQLNYHSVIDQLLQDSMLKFAAAARMQGGEYREWVEGCQFSGENLVRCHERLMEWMFKKFKQAISEEDHARLGLPLGNGKVYSESDDSGFPAPGEPSSIKVSSESPVRRAKGKDDKSHTRPEVPSESVFDATQAVDHFGSRNRYPAASIQPESCTLCKKHKAKCENFYPETGRNVCTHCGQKGHRVERCWLLKPELKAEYLDKEKTTICHICAQIGH
ncbi:uncharacterized protein L3040_005901 [Drepanopeziza brunnea f. sp. 'multigermtubi']|uniref:CCHC-type domain-containing protein n=1 Tax=Marssonina brunnea f. sp. multigermtubi (strain MB_m1) TaxID=1072389 RepID=K1WGJ2_MARBU|nr:uncharacterized protein MBM_09854 [Drepanopeziza brunnea f. sp. 'multigermtubi' MB_m1]EKD11991.1 hypothetical protein MBM_09854 [Drepanopeziza brunnea f. sp. 'multigermtubi' MB_m1]KAJ5040240.1 hypothetical protein L3040_005901 [Drepanopeziza brunnea f. sp. 'multigermtubi']